MNFKADVRCDDRQHPATHEFRNNQSEQTAVGFFNAASDATASSGVAA